MLREHLPPLEHYITDAEALPLQAFLSRHESPMLIIAEPPEEVRESQKPGRGATVIPPAITETADMAQLPPRVSSVPPPPQHQVSEPPSPAEASTDSIPPKVLPATGVLCLPMRPKPGGAPNRVSIGRSPDADVVLIDTSVSRFHAGLSWDTERGIATLADLGARNGTWVDGQRLPDHGEADLRSGVSLRFGAVTARFYAPRGFLAWVTAGAPASGGPPKPWPVVD
jgi:hypothetical protein